jgi:outer membrane protein TolC
MATDADVLSIRVHLAASLETQIRAGNDLKVALAALNEALGQPLDAQFDLTTPLTAAPAPALDLPEFEKRGAAERPELRQAALAAGIAAEQGALAKAAYYPQISFRTVFEADRQQFVNKGGANWFTGVTLRWNLFNGGADKSRIAETAFAAERAAAQKQRAENGVRLQVRKAYLDLKSAEERIQVARSAVAMAEESHRIIQNRYENGLTTVTELLRSETALAGSRMRHLAAVHDQRLATAALLEAAGTLNQDSEL